MLMTCRKCGGDFDVDVTAQQVKAWKDGMLIQNAMPNVSPGERELFITGICDSCFDKMFAE